MPNKYKDPGPLTPRALIAFLESLPEGWKDLPFMDESHGSDCLWPFTGINFNISSTPARMSFTCHAIPDVSFDGVMDSTLTRHAFPPQKPKAT